MLIAQQYFASTHPLPLIKISRQQAAFNINDELMNIFNLGQKRLLSSLIWIETLINSDLEHYKKSDLGSWMFLRFNTLNKIDPNFYEVYRYGGQYLSIVKDDKLGAAKIFERGLKIFPERFWLNFHAAFHYYFELGDLEKAKKLYEKIAFTNKAKINAPYLPSLLARISVESDGISESTFKLLYTSYSQISDNSPIKNRLHANLYAIRAEIDLSCLNSAQNNSCNHYDFDGTPYFWNKELELYQASKTWTKFRISKKNSLR